MPDEALISVCEAYFHRDFRGNLFDLFSYTSHYSQVAEAQRLLTPNEVEKILEEGYGAQLANKLFYLAKPHIDALELSQSGFMKIFEAGKCDNDCFDEMHNANGCRHCENFTKKYLEIDHEAIVIAEANVKAIIDMSRIRGRQNIKVQQGSASTKGKKQE
jgi:hypothetical protein